MFLDLIGLGDIDHGLQPMLLLLIALIVDAAVGGARAPWLPVPHPVRVIGAVVGRLDAKLNRETRSERDRAVRGAVTVLFVVAAAAALGWGVAWLGRHHDFGWIVELLLVTALLAQRSLHRHVRAVAAGLREKQRLEAVGRRPGVAVVSVRPLRSDGCAG